MLTINDMMTVAPKSVALDTPLTEVQRIMRDEGCRHLPVLDGDRLVGIITDRDLRAAFWTTALEHGSAEMIMTANPITVTPDTPAYRAAEMLNLYKFNSLPVVDHGQLVGIVTSTDFLDYFVVAAVTSETHFSVGEF
jgi:acetoin utilization protein AcuB